MHNDTPRKRSQGLAHDIVTTLTQRILLGQMAPGEKLPSESAIVGEYGVSRTVVREALSKLQAAGLVETRHGVGTFVLARDQRQGLHLNHDTAVSVRGILELRLGLETQAPPWPRCAAARCSCSTCARPSTTTRPRWPTTTAASNPTCASIS